MKFTYKATKMRLVSGQSSWLGQWRAHVAFDGGFLVFFWGFMGFFWGFFGGFWGFWVFLGGVLGFFGGGGLM